MTGVILKKAWPILLYLWLASALIGAISTYPIHSAVPSATDAEIFAPGRLMLLEHLRVSVKAIGLASASGFFIFIVGQIAIWCGRARLAALVTDTVFGQEAYRPLLSRVGRFTGVYLLQMLVIGITAASAALALSALPSLEGTLHPARIAAYLAVCLLGAAIALSSTTFFEVWRQALFIRRDRAAVRGLLQGAGPLLAWRTGKAFLGMVFGLVILRVTISPPALGPRGALLTVLLVQALLVVSLLADLMWATIASKSLLSNSPQISRELPRGADRSVRDDGQPDPTPSPDASPG
jgi:hypothetical protein